MLIKSNKIAILSLWLSFWKKSRHLQWYSHLSSFAFLQNPNKNPECNNEQWKLTHRAYVVHCNLFVLIQQFVYGQSRYFIFSAVSVSSVHHWAHLHLPWRKQWFSTVTQLTMGKGKEWKIQLKVSVTLSF